MIADAVLLLGANALFLVAGVGVVAASGWWRDHGWTRASLGLAYLVGVAAYGIVAQALYVVGAPLTTPQVALLCLCLSGVGIAASLRHRAAARAAALPLRIPIAVVAIAAAWLGLVAIDLWYQPLWSYDAWTLWTPKARALVELDGLDTAWFTSADVIWKDYPLLLPAVEAAGFRFTGYRTELLDLQSWLLYVGFLFAFADVVARRYSGIVAWAALLTLALAPTIASQLAGAVADIPLACLFGLGALLLALWLDDRRSSTLLVASVLLAGGAATKVEGLPFALAALVALLSAGLVGRRVRWQVLSVPVAALAAAVAPWQAWLYWQEVDVQGSLTRVLDLDLLTTRVGYLPEIVAFVAVRVLDPTQWLLATPLAAAALAAGTRRGRHEQVVFLALTVLLGLLALVLAYWTTPFELDYHLQTSARRVITPLVVLAVAATPLLAGASRPGTPPVASAR